MSHLKKVLMVISVESKYHKY